MLPLIGGVFAEIDRASDGEEALKKLQRTIADLVLLDLQMPPGDWGGLWFLEQVRQMPINTPVIVVSGMGTMSECIKAVRLGAKNYILKETCGDELARIVG